VEEEVEAVEEEEEEVEVTRPVSLPGRTTEAPLVLSVEAKRDRLKKLFSRPRKRFG